MFKNKKAVSIFEAAFFMLARMMNPIDYIFLTLPLPDE